MKLKTRVFELVGKNKKYRSLAALARAMGISPSQIYRVRDGKRKISEDFIIGAFRAFPEIKKLEKLFYLLPEEKQQVPKIPKPKRTTKKKPAIEQTDIMRTAREVAQLLGVHINTIRRWSNKGALEAYRLGSRGDRRYRQEDLTNFLKQRRTGGEISHGQ